MALHAENGVRSAQAAAEWQARFSFVEEGMAHGGRWGSRLIQAAGVAAFLAAAPGLTAASPPRVLINEIMFHPGLGDPGEEGYVPEDKLKEYIELYNPGSSAINLRGWRFTQGARFVFPDIAIDARGYLVVTADSDVRRFKDAYKTNYPAVATAKVVGGWVGALANNGEDIELENSLGQRMDFVHYAAEGDWALHRQGKPFPGYTNWWRGWGWTCGADAGGKSLELINPAMPTRYGQNWASSLTNGGTPGGPNSVGKTDIAPLILDVRHEPAVPKSNQPVTITARILGESEDAATVTLFHRLDGAAEFIPVVAVDDGQHGDGVAGDDIFGVVLPAQPDKTVVEFYFKARDAANNVRTWPGPTDDQGTQAANAMYQVDDSVYAGDQPVYRIVVSRGEYAVWLNLMDAVNRGRYSDAEMNATWIAADGTGVEVRYCAAVRNRGAGTRLAQPHNFHVAFPQDHPWKGKTGLALNTRSVHAQTAANALASAAGLANTYGMAVQVRLNGTNLANLTPTLSADSQQFGSYYFLEPPNAEWAAEHLPADPNGNIYKGVWYFNWAKLNNNGANLKYLGEDPALYRMAYSTNGPVSTTGAYSKGSNKSEDDWSDLIQLTKTLDTAPDATYVEDVRRVVDVDQWLRFFAVNSLVGNMETTLATAIGDDYGMYRGLVDTRFQLLIHDLDTTLGQGDMPGDPNRAIFYATALEVVGRFLKHPEFAPRYYAILKELAETTFSPSKANPLLDYWLGNWVSPIYIQEMKDFIAARSRSVLSQVPVRLTAAHILEVTNDYPRSTSPSIYLSGKAPAIQTRSVLANGVSASWTQWKALWAAGGITLKPGVNRVLIQAFDGDGIEIDRLGVDIWYDRGSVTSVPAGTLAADARWTAANGPYRVAGNVVVPPARTLTIEPGTTVYFDAGASLIVSGRLVAQGNDTRRIRFTREPGATSNWSGFQFLQTREDNVLAYADIEHADSGAQVFLVDQSRLLVDRLTVTKSFVRTFDIREPRIAVLHSVFGDVDAHNAIRVEGMPNDGWLVLENNLFGLTTGDNDVIELNHVSRKNGPIARVKGNVFLGSGGDILACLETDAHIEGNLFMHANPTNTAQSASAAITSGPATVGGTPNLFTQHLTIVRNLFYQNDYGVLIKTGAYADTRHNAFVGNRGAMLFDEPWRADSGPGRGAYVESCIFWNNGPEDDQNGSGTFVHINNRSPEGHSQLVVNRSILEALFHSYGTGNIDADPRFRKPHVTADLTALIQQFGAGFNGLEASPFLIEWGAAPDLRLDPGSPAIGAGRGGGDMGAFVPPNAWVSGTPASPTWLPQVTIAVGGADLSAYKYRISGPGHDNLWSTPMAEVKTVESIQRTGATATATAYGHGYANGDTIEIRGAEHLAYNGLFTVSNVTADTFSYAVAGTPPNAQAPADIACRKPQAIQVGGLADGAYRLEVIGKNSLGVWQAETNATVAAWEVNSSFRGSVRLNELLARNSRSFLANGGFPDAVEILNDGPIAADLSGLSLSDDAINPRRFVFPFNTSLGAGQYLVLLADTDFTAPGLHLGFRLPQSGGILYLFDKPANGGGLLDSVSWGLQVPDYSIGRLDDGSWSLTRPTLGGPNVRQPLGNRLALRINEWLARGRSTVLDGFIELYNPDLLPAALDGLTLVPNVLFQANEAPFPSLSFIAGQGCAVFYPDGQPELGGEHLGFKLRTLPGAIGLFDSDQRPIDVVHYGPQTTDRSQGRSPNGSSVLVSYDRPSPGVGNPVVSVTNIAVRVINLVTMTNVWRFNQTDALAGDWFAANYAGEASWPASNALFYVEDSSLPAPKNTPLTIGRNTYYFRTRFNVNTNLEGAKLSLRTLIDDGAVFYLNGSNFFRIHMPDGAVDYDTHAHNHEATLEGAFEFPTAGLVQGDNTLAVEVHQVDTNSADIVFGMALQAVVTITNVSTNVSPPIVFLNEVLANNATLTNQPGLAGDWIELHNPSAQAADLSGMSLTDDPELPQKWVFPSGSTLEAGRFLVIGCDPRSPVSSTNTGFGLDSQSGSIYLLAPPALDRVPVDLVDYGLQVADYSIGRAGDSGAWILSIPTPRAPNAQAPLGGNALLKINEWMANPVAGDDWFELYSPESRPVELSGLSLSDDPENPALSPIRALSFLGTGLAGYQAFHADDSPIQGAHHVKFRLKSSGDFIGLFSREGTPIDSVRFGPQIEGISEGRAPDGSVNVVSFLNGATPGAPNTPDPNLDSDGDGMPDTWEIAHGFNPQQSWDALVDSDGDGLSNLAEYRAGTDPRDPLSVFAIHGGINRDGVFSIQFVAMSGLAYTVQYRDSLSEGTWLKLADVPAGAGARAIEVPDPSSSRSSVRYYRIVTPATP